VILFAFRVILYVSGFYCFLWNNRVDRKRNVERKEGKLFLDMWAYSKIEATDKPK
jgi:hypothetical protein